MFKNIVIPVDLSDKQSIDAVFPPALNVARKFSAKLHLVHIIPDFGMKMVEDYLPRSWVGDQKVKYRESFERIIKKYIPSEIEVEYFVGKGAIYDQIINYTERVEADLIIVSAVRPQLKDYMLGPNASKIVRHSPVSVMVVRN